MRMLWLAAAILIAAPARADVTARYTMGFASNVMPPMIVEVNDRGDAHITMGNQAAAIILNGDDYLIQADLHGIYVARWEDLTALLGERFQAMGPHPEFRHGTDHPPTPAVPAFVERGTETVAGRTGTVWSQRVAGVHGGPISGMDIVISSDPDLAPLARVFVRQFQTSLNGLRTMMGSTAAIPGSSSESMLALLARGAPLRMGQIMRLESVDTRPIAPSEFVLPATPLTRAELAARLGWTQVPAPVGGAH
jgi:hypothetical protein